LELEAEKTGIKIYDHVLSIFAEFVASKSDVRQITAEDVKQFLAWRKSKGFDPGTTLYTDRVILHNFFNRLKIENPVKPLLTSRFCVKSRRVGLT
jgi:site-specific recombinase XerD